MDLKTFKKFEQSGFIFESASGFRLGVDIGNKTPIENLEGVACDAMLVSHIHGDHFFPENIRKLSPKDLYLNDECRASLPEGALSCELKHIEAGMMFDVGDFKINAFTVDHGPNINPLKENLGFLIKVDGKKIYFPGDMFYPSGIDTTTLEVDLLLVPVGTHYTFGPQEAIDFVKTFKGVAMVVPMHFENKPETRDEFLELARKEGIPAQN